MKKIFVIGSNSFSAGSFIKLLLLKNYKVYGISRSKLNPHYLSAFNLNHRNFTFKRYDLNKDNKNIINFIKKINPDNLVNFASQSMVGESWENPLHWYKTNSFSTIELFYKISNLKKKPKIIQISTPEMYGNIKKLTYENENYNPTTPYAASRVTADHFLKLLYNQKKINYIIVRPSNVYGEYQKLYRIIPRTIYKILKKERLNLHGGGFSKRNYIHIDDVSDAILKVIQKGKNGNCYHISSDKLISIREIVEIICKKMNYNFKKLAKISSTRRGTDDAYFLSSKKIKKELKWKSAISIDEGIDRTIKWIRDNLKNFKKKDLDYNHKK